MPGDDLDLPDELYGFAGWLLWMVATRATTLVDQVYELGLAHRSAEYGTVDGHPAPTPSVIAWLITAAERGADVARLADRTPEITKRQKSLRTLVGRAVTTDPHAFQVGWLHDLGAICGLSAAEIRLLADSREDGAHPVDPRALRRAIERTLKSGLAVATRTLPRDVAAFTGRDNELLRVAEAAGPETEAGPSGARGVLIFAIGGMAGVGKTAFATHAAHLLAPRFPDGQFFLSLNGHTPGQRPTDPADALGSLLLTAGIAATTMPPGLEPRARLWRDRLDGKRVLLVLDDAIGHEQVTPLLPPSPGSLVLITSRRRLVALEDAHAISLDMLSPGEAAELFIRLADRPDLDAGAVADIAAACGYLPLAVSMLARQLHHHPAWSAADLAAELSAVTDRLSLLTAEDRSVSAAFDLSYATLTPGARRLLRRLSLHPGTTIDAWAAAALDDTSVTEARSGLLALYDHHLLAEPAPGRFRFHDLVREYAANAAATEEAGKRDAAVRRLLDFYLATAGAAGAFLSQGRRPALPAPAMMSPAPDTPRMRAAADAVRWMEAERLNLDAIVRHASASGYPGHAAAILSAMREFIETRGHADQGAALCRAILPALAGSGNRRSWAWIRTDLGGYLRGAGDLEASIATLTAAAEAFAETADPAGEATARYLLGWTQFLIDDYQASAANTRRSLGLYRDLGNQLGEADALTNLGYVQYAGDDFPAAAASLERAILLYEEHDDLSGQRAALNYLASVQQMSGDLTAAAASFARSLRCSQVIEDHRGEAVTRTTLGYLQCILGQAAEAAETLEAALRLQREVGNRLGEASALTYLGLARRLAGDYESAVAFQGLAIDLYRACGSRLGEGNAMQELGMAQHGAGDHRAALASEERALALYREIDDVISQAEVLNNTGDIITASDGPAAARSSYEQALNLVSTATAPMEEARALEGLGVADQANGKPAEAAERLRRALALYQQIGSPNAARVAALLGLTNSTAHAYFRTRSPTARDLEARKFPR